MGLVEARRGIADRVVALTFDDGPSPWTEPIAEQLERHGGRGTFFAIGEEVDDRRGAPHRPPAARRGPRGGEPHVDARRPPADRRRDDRGRDAPHVRRCSPRSPGRPVDYWRAPFFRRDERVRAAVGDVAGREVWFSSMPGDWSLPAEETAAKVLADLEAGDIVVLHDGRPANEPPELSWPTREATVDAVALILEEMARRGLRSVTVSELLASS